MIGLIALLALEFGAIWCVVAGRAASHERLWPLALLGLLAAAQAVAGTAAMLLPGIRDEALSFVAWSGIAFASLVAAPAFASPTTMHIAGAGLACAVVLVAGLILDWSCCEPAGGPAGRGAGAWIARILLLNMCLGLALLSAAMIAPPIQNACAGARDELDAAWRGHVWRRGLRATPLHPGAGAAADVGQRGPVVLSRHEVSFGPLPSQAHMPQVFLRILQDIAPTSAMGRVYMRLMTYNAFVGKAWTTVAAKPVVVADRDDGLADGWATLADGSEGTIDYMVTAAPATGGIVPTMPRLESMKLPGVLAYPEGAVASPVVVNVPLVSFRAKSAPLDWDAVPDAARIPGEAGDAATWLDNSAVISRIQAEAFEVVPEGRADPQAVPRLLRYFAGSFKYSRTPPVDTSGHPLDLFLFEHKMGHCELFASGLVLLLRSLGIPARFSIGYSGGRYDPRSGLLVFYADDAHAWAEVFLAGQGWVVVDPTPAGTPGVPDGPRVEDLSAVVSGMGADLADIIDRTQKSGLAALSGGGSKESFVLLGVAPSLLIAPLAVAILALAGLFAGERRTARDAAGSRLDRRSGIAFFDKLCRHYAGKGFARKRGETPLEYLARLKDAGVADAGLEQAFDYFCDVCYGTRPRDRTLEEQYVVRP